MPKDKIKKFRITWCGKELSIAILFIIEKGLAEEYKEWARDKRKELYEMSNHE